MRAVDDDPRLPIDNFDTTRELGRFEPGCRDAREFRVIQDARSSNARERECGVSDLVFAANAQLSGQTSPSRPISWRRGDVSALTVPSAPRPRSASQVRASGMCL